MEITSERLWRDIPGYEHYEVSNDGLVRSKHRVVMMKNGVTKTVRERILSPFLAGAGYVYVRVRKGNNASQPVHRLVAKAFLGEQPGKEVNHKDENKLNNRVENLEWVTRQENLRYGTRNAKCAEIGMKRAKPVLAYYEGKLFKRYASLHEVGRDGFSRQQAGKCCKGERGPLRGYTFVFAGHDTGDTSYARKVMRAAEGWREKLC